MKPYKGRKHKGLLNAVVVLTFVVIVLLVIWRMDMSHEAEKAAWQARREIVTEYIPVPDVRVVRVVVTPEATIEPEAKPEATPYIALTDDERTLIATVCESEGNVHGIEGLTAVACTIRNRLLDGRFGDGIEGVCTPGQFHGLRDPKDPSEDAYEAVDTVFQDGCEDVTAGALYFCTGDPSAIKAGLRLTAEVGGHCYYTDKEDKS